MALEEAQAQLVAARQQADAASGAIGYDLDRVRAQAGSAKSALPPGPELHEVADLTIPGTTLRARRYRPTAEPAPGTVVHLHGGGWVSGDIDTSDALLRVLAARSGLEYVSIDYRLAPEHPFPAAVDDGRAALEWATSLGRPVIVHGDSAGGNLAAAAVMDLAPGQLDRIALQVLVYPVVDADFSRPSYLEHADDGLLTADQMRWFWDTYVPAAQRQDPRILLLQNDFRHCPPTLLVVAEYDPLRDDALALREALTQAGVEVTLWRVDDSSHSFLRLVGLSPRAASVAASLADESRRRIEAWWARQVGGSARGDMRRTGTTVGEPR